MDIPKTLKEVVSNTPELIDENTIEITRVEKWEVLKSDLLAAKETLTDYIVLKQSAFNEINEYLTMFGEETIPGEEAIPGDDVMAYTSRCKVRLSERQTVPQATWTILNLDDVIWDNDNEWDIVNKRFIAKETGYYHVSYHVESSVLGSNPDEYLAGAIFKNGVKHSITGQIVANRPGSSQSHIGTTDIYLEVGDYIDVRVVHEDYVGGPSTTFPPETYRNWFAIHRFA